MCLVYHRVCSPTRVKWYRYGDDQDQWTGQRIQRSRRQGNGSQERPASGLGLRGARPRDEDQGQQQGMDVVVPRGWGSAATVLCQGATGGIRAVRGGLCGFRCCDRHLVYVAEGVGRRCGTRRGERASDGEYGEAERVRGGRHGSAAVAASRFRGRALSSAVTTRRLDRGFTGLQGTRGPG